MFLQRNKKIKHFFVLIAAFLLTGQSVWAAGPPAPSIFNNALALTLLVLMALLLIVIAVLGSILVGAADIKVKKKKKENSTAITSVILLFLLLSCPAVFAQEAVAETATTTAAKTINGMPSSTFYLMITVIFLELAIILAMLVNIRFLLKNEKEKLAIEAAEAQKNKITWWDKINSLRPATKEVDTELDLGHDYDGIRELNNKLPPWWIYGFYLTIIFAVVYLWRFHVSHTGPSSQQEYETSVARAELKTQAYLKSKGEAVDENTVTLLTNADDIAAGKVIYMKSCATCHTETGAGNVGPNLTDNYWLHGNDVKSIFKVIRYGINAMPQWQNSYSNKQMAQVTSYLKSIVGSNPPNPKAPQGTEMKEESSGSTTAGHSANIKDTSTVKEQ